MPGRLECSDRVLVAINTNDIGPLSVFFFKQKTAYEISECDWSPDVCSSDLSRLTAYPKSRWNCRSTGEKIWSIQYPRTAPITPTSALVWQPACPSDIVSARACSPNLEISIT